MPVTTIKGIPVSFPFPPYDIQVNYMEKVIECLQDRKNGVLESPTGTGKTLSLLCASLAWLEAKKAEVRASRQSFGILDQLKSIGGTSSTETVSLGTPTIIYASRTHTQLTQAVQELKRSNYNHVKALVIGSREQMCVLEEVVNVKNKMMKVQVCRKKVREESCVYYNEVEAVKTHKTITDLNVIDIEDLVKLGQDHCFCPYYMAKELKHDKEVIFVPYNYLLDPKTRTALGLELANNIVIFDEGHNIEKACEESASIQLKSSDLTLCIEEIMSAMKAPKDFTGVELSSLRDIFLNFEKALNAIVVKSSFNEGTYFEGSYIYELFAKAGITDTNLDSIRAIIDKIVLFLTTRDEGSSGRKGAGLQLFADLLSIVFASSSAEFRDNVRKSYKVHVGYEEGSPSTTFKNKVLSCWCFSPGFGMNMLMEQGVHCVIVTSGTLAPLKPLISELGLQVDVSIENPHIIQDHQICVKVVTNGPDNELLICNYQNRDNSRYLRSLGQVLMNFIRNIPGGVLVFFPSYPIMLNCQRSWQHCGIWRAINDTKPIFVEPKDKITFTTTMKEYYAKINDRNLKGAIFMGVCRGKVSEGLDFADQNGRAVFIIGLPYPPLKDAKIILKKRYLDVRNTKNPEYLTGDEWYRLEATRAINQAIGRVIRHKNDYGAIILLDSRFAQLPIKQNLSKWIQKHLQAPQSFGVTVRGLKQFFENAATRVPIQSQIRDESTPPPTPKECGNSGGSTTAISLPSTSGGWMKIHKRKREELNNSSKKAKFLEASQETTTFPIETSQATTVSLPSTSKRLAEIHPDSPKSAKVIEASQDTRIFDRGLYDVMTMSEKEMSPEMSEELAAVTVAYKNSNDLQELKKSLNEIFLRKRHLRRFAKALAPHVLDSHQMEFLSYCNHLELQ